MQKQGAKAMAPRGEADVTDGSILSDFDIWQADHLWPGISEVFSTSQMGTNVESFVDTDDFTALNAGDSAHILEAEVTEVKSLTSLEGHPKYHMEVRLPGSVRYNVGDYLEVYPKNSPRDKENLMAILRERGHNLDDPLIETINSHLELHQQASAKVKIPIPMTLGCH